MYYTFSEEELLVTMYGTHPLQTYYLESKPGDNSTIGSSSFLKEESQLCLLCQTVINWLKTKARQRLGDRCFFAVAVLFSVFFWLLLFLMA